MARVEMSEPLRSQGGGGGAAGSRPPSRRFYSFFHFMINILYYQNEVDEIREKPNFRHI